MMARSTHKRYANAKDYEILRNGKSIMILKLNEKNPAEEKRELMKLVQLANADQVFLVWTARDGKCREEMVI